MLSPTFLIEIRPYRELTYGTYSLIQTYIEYTIIHILFWDMSGSATNYPLQTVT